MSLYVLNTLFFFLKNVLNTHVSISKIKKKLQPKIKIMSI